MKQSVQQLRVVALPEEPPALYNQVQTCRLLGVSRFTVYRMSRDGQLHPIMVRGARRYRRDEILAIAAEGTARIEFDGNSTRCV